MKQRTLILRLWRDADNQLQGLLDDPLSEARASFVCADELWAALEAWAQGRFAASPFLDLERGGTQADKENE